MSAEKQHCSNCGFELVKKDKFCPKCGAKIRVKRRPIVIILILVATLISVSFALYLIFFWKSNVSPVQEPVANESIESANLDNSASEAVNRDNNTNSLQSVFDETVGLDISAPTKTPIAVSDESDYHSCGGGYPLKFDEQILGMTKGDFFTYTGIDEKDYEYFKLTEGDKTYISERRDYSFKYDGVDVKAYNAIYYIEGKVVAFTFSMSFDENTIDAAYMDRLYEKCANFIMSKGDGWYYKDDSDNLYTLDVYIGELCWKDEKCYTMLNAENGTLSQRYLAIDYMDNHGDIYSSEFSQAYSEQIAEIRSAHGGDGPDIDNSNMYRPEYDSELPEYILGSVCVYDRVAVVGYKDYFVWEDGYISDIILVYYFDPDGRINRCVDYRSVPNITFANEKCIELTTDYRSENNTRNYYGFENWQATYYFSDSYVVAEMSQEHIKQNGMTEFGAIAEIVNNCERGGWNVIRK